MQFSEALDDLFEAGVLPEEGLSSGSLLEDLGVLLLIMLYKGPLQSLENGMRDLLVLDG